MNKYVHTYLLTVVAFTAILPLLFTTINVILGSTAPVLAVWSTWFIVCALGLRLFCAGLVQLFKPTYTLHTIFNIGDIKSAALVQELGVHNILFGAASMSTLVLPQYRYIMLCIGGAYFGSAGVLHVLHHEKSFNQRIAMISDLIIAGVALAIIMLGVL